MLGKVSSAAIPVHPSGVNPSEYTDEDIVFSEDDLVKLSEEIMRKKTEDNKIFKPQCEEKTQPSRLEAKSNELIQQNNMARRELQQFTSFKDFCKYLSRLLGIPNSGKKGCFIILQSSRNINENILGSTEFNGFRFIGFPCPERLTGSVLRNLPQRGDPNFVKNAGVYYGSSNDLANSNSEPFLPVEVESLRNIAQSLGGA